MRSPKMKTASLALCLLFVAACARSEDASVRPADGNDSAVEQVRATDVDDQEPALGEWRRALQEDRPALEFGPAGTAPLIGVVCGERGGLILQRAGAIAPGAAPTLSVTVGGQGRQLPVTPAPGAAPMQRAAIPAGDTLLAQLAGAQAPISLRFGDGTPLILPPSGEIARFVQGCASGFRDERAAGAGAANGQAAANGQPPAAAEPAPAGNEANAASAR